MNQLASPILRAVQAAGGQTELARRLGVTPPTVSQWGRGERQVPAERCPQIERETRQIAQERSDPTLVVTCEELRPDIEWAVVRENAAAMHRPAEEARDAA